MTVTKNIIEGSKTMMSSHMLMAYSTHDLQNKLELV